MKNGTIFHQVAEFKLSNGLTSFFFAIFFFNSNKNPFFSILKRQTVIEEIFNRLVVKVITKHFNY